MSLEPRQFAQFGTFCFDLRQRVLRRDGEIIAVPPKDLEILVLLIQGHGQIVEKKEILEAVWPKMFVEEANVSRHVFNLRQILCENGQRSIETIPKRGYRFVVPVQFRSSAAEVISLVRGVIPHQLSLAVLPIQNLTGDPSKDHICGGLKEELIAQIAAISPSELRVIPRTPSKEYRTTAKNAAKIARELQADYLIEASLRESKGRFRVTAKLIRFPEQRYIWIREFDRTPTDLIAMEDEISQSVAKFVGESTQLPPVTKASAFCKVVCLAVAGLC
jgi:TolB-like protein